MRLRCAVRRHISGLPLRPHDTHGRQCGDGSTWCARESSRHLWRRNGSSDLTIAGEGEPLWSGVAEGPAMVRCRLPSPASPLPPHHTWHYRSDSDAKVMLQQLRSLEACRWADSLWLLRVCSIWRIGGTSSALVAECRLNCCWRGDCCCCSTQRRWSRAVLHRCQAKSRRSSGRAAEGQSHLRGCSAGAHPALCCAMLGYRCSAVGVS